MKKRDNQNNAQALVGFMIIIVGAAIFLVYYVYKDAIVRSNNFQLFMLLTVVAMGFLLWLLYLAGKPHTRHKSFRRAHVKSAKPVRKRRR